METPAQMQFNGVTLEAIEYNGQPWIRYPQIADAMGYIKSLTPAFPVIA